MIVNAEQQREALNQAGYEMLTLCHSQLEKAKEAFLNNDTDLAEEVINNESRVNALDLKIERDCERFIALYNPVAIDLRFIMALRKINIDLERIGDHAFDIAIYIMEEGTTFSENMLEVLQFNKMYEIIESMIENIHEAYDNELTLDARKVFKKDKSLDKIYEASFKVIEKEVKKDVNNISEALRLFAVIKKLERVGDLLKNIAEEIIFYREAEQLKHKKKKKKN
jgi:phosphate transport system protein